MRILQLHVDFVEYKLVKKEIKDAEPAERGKSERFENILLLLTSVEEGDSKELAKNAIEEIKEFLQNLGINRILIYPFAHLSRKLEEPRKALQLLKFMEEYAKQKGIETYRSPFGWNKSLEIRIKGHPLAEQLRIFEKVRKVVATEKKDKFHRFVLMDIDGKTYEISKDNWERCEIFAKHKRRYELLKFFVRNELVGKPEKKGMPRHIEYMRKLELVDYCPESDIGHMKWYPNGMLVKDLIMDYAFFNIALKWGAFKMQNPLLYRMDVEEIKKLQGEFHERDYILKENAKKFVLRFASDPGAFPFVQKTVFSYKQMPVKVYEEAICFRKEQAGEVVGLMRVRNFWMTDQHAFCLDEEQAREEYAKLTILFAKLMNEILAKDYWVLGFEIVEEFFEKYKKFFEELVRQIKVPAFFKLMREMSHYYAFKNEFQAIFPDGNNLQISTVQWDIKNGERFNICYMDEKGRKVPVPFIIHASSFGSIERALAAILETAAWREKEGKLPMLPVWLSPEQVRIIPVSNEKHLERCIEVAETLEKNRIRVGVDDRDLSVPKKVFEAKSRWIPYIVVIGDRELERKKFPVVVRERSTKDEEVREEMSVEQLVEEIKRKCKQMPFRPLYIPREMSKRVTFVPWGK